MTPAPSRIAFQGEKGAYSHIASRQLRPDMAVLPCPTFEDVFASISAGDAELAVVPIENSLVGRVADIHHLLPESGLFITGEHFLPIHHHLLSVKGADPAGLKQVLSHAMALGQCRKIIRQRRLVPVVWADTAGAARHLAQNPDPSRAALASDLAAEIHGLDIAQRQVEDSSNNITRFLLVSAHKAPENRAVPLITSFVFRVRNVPAALYKALGGFATNSVNMTRLESCQLDGDFSATRFYADIEGHPQDPSVAHALDELAFFAREIHFLGTYPASPLREKLREKFKARR